MRWGELIEAGGVAARGVSAGAGVPPEGDPLSCATPAAPAVPGLLSSPGGGEPVGGEVGEDAAGSGASVRARLPAGAALSGSRGGLVVREKSIEFRDERTSSEVNPGALSPSSGASNAESRVENTMSPMGGAPTGARAGTSPSEGIASDRRRDSSHGPHADTCARSS